MSRYTDPVLVRAIKESPEVAAVEAHVQRLLDTMRRCCEHTPEDEARQAAIGYAHRAAVLRRNELIRQWSGGEKV